MVKEEISSILVIKSVPMPRTFEVFKKLREEYPKTEISMLVQEEVKDEIEKSGLIDKVIVEIKKGRISLFRYLPLVFRLRREVFDLVAVIYDTEDIGWYGNLRLFASAIRAKERAGIAIDNILQPFDRKESIFRSVFRFLQLILFIPLTIFLIIFLIPFILFYHLRRYVKRFKNFAFFTHLKIRKEK